MATKQRAKPTRKTINVRTLAKMTDDATAAHRIDVSDDGRFIFEVLSGRNDPKLTVKELLDALDDDRLCLEDTIAELESLVDEHGDKPACWLNIDTVLYGEQRRNILNKLRRRQCSKVA